MGVVVFAAAAVGLMAWLLTVGSGSAAGKPSAPKVVTVTVTAGKPSELAFKLSKSSNVTPGLVVFKVKNAGKLTHDFKICTRPAKTSAANTCTGKATKRLAAGQSATMTSLNLKKGQYEYLCTVPGHATAGMKGLIGIGVKVTTPTTGVVGGSTTATATTTAKTTTTAGPPAATEALVGSPGAGAAVWASAGCGSCHTLRAAGSTGNVGPNLDDSHPGQDIVIQRVTNGINVMPAFAGQLTTGQIMDLAAYVYQSTHT
jgi:mono/diheme cytochrome c family protein